MNFFSHAVVASWQSSVPRFVLGAMLPDLTGMIGVRLRSATDVEVQRGVELHYATDSAFHAAPVFTRLCAEAITRLTEQGVERGTARAVAHVGVELTLDGVLSDDIARRSLYADALAVAVRGELDGKLEVTPEGGVARLIAGLGRLARAPLPQAYADPNVVAERLQVILAPRPRLAMKPSDLEPVRTWAHAIAPAVAARSRELLEQVRRGIR